LDRGAVEPAGKAVELFKKRNQLRRRIFDLLDSFLECLLEETASYTRFEAAKHVRHLVHQLVAVPEAMLHPVHVFVVLARNALDDVDALAEKPSARTGPVGVVAKGLGRCGAP